MTGSYDEDESSQESNTQQVGEEGRGGLLSFKAGHCFCVVEWFIMPPRFDNAEAVDLVFVSSYRTISSSFCSAPVLDVPHVQFVLYSRT
ncbi:hypothetical protein J6590_032397 [Homalodisca vitripennis]|nr:hypothetical protein J6590_032397 [Homalodisca vitripennis]